MYNLFRFLIQSVVRCIIYSDSSFGISQFYTQSHLSYSETSLNLTYSHANKGSMYSRRCSFCFDGRLRCIRFGVIYLLKEHSILGIAVFCADDKRGEG